MNPSSLMKLGSATVLVGFAGVVFVDELHVMASIMMAMGGVVFGKGYGVWESRQ